MTKEVKEMSAVYEKLVVINDDFDIGHFVVMFEDDAMPCLDFRFGESGKTARRKVMAAEFTVKGSLDPSTTYIEEVMVLNSDGTMSVMAGDRVSAADSLRFIRDTLRMMRV